MNDAPNQVPGGATDHATIERFYAAFAQLDGVAMQACYAAEAQFDDPVFSLRGAPQIGAMWRMLCDTTRAKGMAHWRLAVSDVSAQGSHGSAHWEAHYLFSATGRLVHNRIDARFDFDPSGLITRHQDEFDFWRWSRQALGARGSLLGWSPWLRGKVRAQALSNLRRFRERTG